MNLPLRVHDGVDGNAEFDQRTIPDFVSAEFDFGELAFGDVVEDRHDFAGRQFEDVIIDPNRQSVVVVGTGREAVRECPSPRRVGKHRKKPDVHRSGKDLGNQAAHDFVAFHPADAFRGGIELLNDEIRAAFHGIVNGHAVAHIVEHQAESFFVRPQGFFGLLLFGDVHDRSDETLRLAEFVVDVSRLWHGSISAIRRWHKS